MTLTISDQTYHFLFEAVLEQEQYLDPEDQSDVIIPYPSALGREQMRQIALREGLLLEIESYQQYEDLAVSCDKCQEHIRMGFHLSGFHRSSQVTVCPGEYALSGSGIVPDLLQRLDNPPSLMELARMVGLNDRALKQGFRACFGTTTFNYLHHYRLEQAQQLLATGDLRIEEVAQRVGFSNRSYFAEAFRKKFGINPGEFARQQRQ